MNGVRNFPRYKIMPVADLRPYARNPRTHSEFQVRQIVASITAFGFTNPVLIDPDGGLIAGHGRLQAALQLGMTEIPVIVLDDLTEDERRALVIADNKLALNAGWNDDLLLGELQALDDAGFDLGLTGFREDELSVLFADKTEGLTDPDDVPDAPAVPITEVGDVWLLGRHRLVCGDSTTAEAVDAALAGVRPHLMVTDPPYGVAYDASWRNVAARTSRGMGNRAIGAVLNDHRADWREAWALFPGDVAYVWCSGLHIHLAADSLEQSGFDLRASIIWAKSNFAIGRGDYHWQHEPCWYAVRKGKAGHYQGDRKQTTLWEIPKPSKSETGHSTQRPVECMRRPIENNSSPGQAVYEPFCGSGTTIIAAEMTGRTCHAIELSPVYVDVAVLRWQAFTGQVATHAVTGQPFGADATQAA